MTTEFMAELRIFAWRLSRDIRDTDARVRIASHRVRLERTRLDRTSGRNKYYSFNEDKRNPRRQIRLSRSARRKTDGARRQDALK